MSRLIDADALLESISKVSDQGYKHHLNRQYVLDLIDNATTIQREGWVSVPIEPTQEMCQAGQIKAREWNAFPLGIAPIYQSMISAAPKE